MGQFEEVPASGVTVSKRVLSDHLCECGCGERTYIARQTNEATGVVRGQPHRFRLGHHQRKRQHMAEPNPSGLCMCGCGKPTKLATSTSTKNGWVQGKPRKYLTGHHGRMSRTGWDVDAAGCWIWRGHVAANGRGYTKVGGIPTLAYRFVYEERVGPIPDGHHLHHLCENPMCVNPGHLEPLTPAAHVARHPR